ncbi:MAG TPA: NAD(P)/FAD-dependent oxidoreductase [Rhodanobacteraceae bacterium]|jgi:thioredoxin reductase (NADPH)|nr:NAD(P)/FAD-dependent oxidoreductase [Rhodanobacteraceae bacterium]
MIVTDVVIIGAGPVGLFQVFELGLLDLKAQVVDSMPQVGGQCIELYPDKPIYDIPAIPVCDARELVDRLMQQIKPFAPEFHLGQEVTEVSRQDTGRFFVRTSTGTQFDAAAVIIAGGVGTFRPRQLNVDGAARVEGRQLHYKIQDPALFAGKDIIIAGAGDSALDWVLALHDKCNSLILLHRSHEFRAMAGKVRQMEQLCNEQRMQFLEGDISALEIVDDALKSVSVRTKSGVTTRVGTDHLVVLWGLHPKLGPIANWGLNLDKSQIEVDTAKFSTNVPGIFAVGDINTYPGKKKLILSGFHETALAAFGVRELLSPGEKVYLQYTTTSPIMHKRLGVEPLKKVRTEGMAAG